MNITDIRSQAPRHPIKKATIRPVTGIVRATLHHGATRRGLGGTNYLAYLRYHVQTNGWSVGGYTYGVEPDGEAKQGYDHDIQTPHVGNYNRASLGIVLPGDFRFEEPTPEQWDTAVKLVQKLLVDMPSIREVVGHQEIPGYSWKQCPAFSMDEFRQDVRRKNVRAAAKVTYKGQAVEAFIEDGKTYAQLRDLTNLTGAALGWNQATKRATVNGKQVDGINVDGRVYMHVREIAALLNLTISYNNNTKTTTLA